MSSCTTTYDTSNIDDKVINKIRVKDPFKNIMTLLEQVVRIRNDKPKLLDKLKLLTDSDFSLDIQSVDEMEKIEQDIKFIDEYSNNLLIQAACIMNEHNVSGIPSLDFIQNKFLTQHQ